MTSQPEQNLDLDLVWRGIKRHLLWLLVTMVTAGGAVYFWSKSQPPVFAASSSLVSGTGGQSSNAVIGDALVRASPLPEGAIAQAVWSEEVILQLVESIRASEDISLVEKAALVQRLQHELYSGQHRTLTLTAEVEPFANGNGIYTLTAKAGDPKSAAAAANLAADTLRAWDRSRATEAIVRAESGLRAQLAQVDDQLKAQNLDRVERDTLVASRSTIVKSLSTASLLRDSAVGVLSPLARAVPPLEPSAPRPLRNAILATLTAGLLLGAALIGATLLDRTIRSDDDLLPLGLTSLAAIPKIQRRSILTQGIINTARQEGVYEALGFLRVHLATALQDIPHPVVLVTSTTPGEGKSTLSSALADALSSNGRRVLLIDADLRRGQQENIWQRVSKRHDWVQLTGEGGARTIQDALRHPENVQVMRVQETLDLLPAGKGLQDSLSVFSQSDIGAAFALWRKHYDIVLIDSAPLLALADGLMVGAHTDGVVIVTEYGKTHMQALKNALNRAKRNGLNPLGVVINKIDGRGQSAYHYSYSYSAGNN